MSDKYKYNSWPLGKVPKHLQRPELDKLKELGYTFDDPRDVVDIFEKKIAAYTGSKYAVTVDCCTHGLMLCMKYCHNQGYFTEDVTIPARTYISVPHVINQCGYKVRFDYIPWNGFYQLDPFPIADAAVRFTKNMYDRSLTTFMVLSFQIKKVLPIGRGGAILTDSEYAAKWLKLASYDGRDLTLPYDHPNHFVMQGWHVYMTPEDAARGIILMDQLPEHNGDMGNYLNYTDLSTHKGLFK